MVAAILSWLFDITPDSVRRTESRENATEDEEAINTGRRKLRPSDIVIGVLLIAVVILVYPKIFNKDDLKGIRDSAGKISIAVMPFENLSGDTLYNIWQGGFQNLLISTLSISSELTVRRYLAVNDLLNQKKK